MKKTLKKTKKVSKKVAKKSTIHTTEVVVRVQPMAAPTAKDIESPLKDGGKYMIPKTWMSEKMVMRLVQKTDPKYVYTRPGKGGQTFSYVTGNYVEKVLNYSFGWNWDFEIVAHGKEQDQVWVQGKLTVKDDQGHTIIKSQFGRADIKYLKGTKNMLDFGNDLKGAATDSLKKCASLLGIASDIYGKAEYKQETGIIPVDNNSKQPFVAPVDYDTMIECHECGELITPQEAEYSKKMYGKPLCRAHQAEAKRNK